jgi:glucose/mannose-6-phosphate isomerase
MQLDDSTAVRTIDKSDMLATMEKTIERLAPPANANETCNLAPLEPRNIIFAGVGGSGIVGDVLCDYSRRAIGIPSFVCRASRIPSFVDENTLFIAISFSGDTNETLGMLDQARRAHARLATVTSGGKLHSNSIDEKIPYVEVPRNLIPRVALPELLAATIFVLGKGRVVRDTDSLLEATRAAVRQQIDLVKASVPQSQNKAKQAAAALNDRLPLLIGDEENASVLRRFKNELNENAKVPAFYMAIPEAFHDDIEGFATLRQLSKTQPLFLHSPEESAGETKTVEKLEELLVELGYPPPIAFEGKGTERLGWLLSAITFGDYVSAYLAILRSIDPSTLALIPKFRAIRGQV